MLGSTGNSTMKIGPQGTGDDLLARMQEAAEAAKSEKVSNDFSVPAQEASSKVDPTGPGTQPAEPTSNLSQRLKVTAANALEGKTESADAVRSEVVDIVIDEKYGDTLSGKEKRKLTKNLKAALVDDPTFKREVDSMLLMAARDIGTSRG